MIWLIWGLFCNMESICPVCANGFEKRGTYKKYCSKKCSIKGYNDTHKDEAKKYYKKNKDIISERNKKFYEKNKDIILKRNKKFREDNKDKIKKQTQKNKHKKREQERKRIQGDINFKLRKIIRSRACKTIKKNSGKKAYKTEQLLGCSIQEVRCHLEKQFKEGMTWDNYGNNGWHIDHIIPCASFDLTDPEQQKKCFHYTNLQPLWAKENMSKGSKIIPLDPATSPSSDPRHHNQC